MSQACRNKGDWKLDILTDKDHNNDIIFAKYTYRSKYLGMDIKTKHFLQISSHSKLIENGAYKCRCF